MSNALEGARRVHEEEMGQYNAMSFASLDLFIQKLGEDILDQSEKATNQLKKKPDDYATPQ